MVFIFEVGSLYQNEVSTQFQLKFRLKIDPHTTQKIRIRPTLHHKVLSSLDVFENSITFHQNLALVAVSELLSKNMPIISLHPVEPYTFQIFKHVDVCKESLSFSDILGLFHIRA